MTNIVKSSLNKEQTTAWLRGLMTIAYADGELDTAEKDLFDHFSHEEFASKIEISELKPISPDDLAKVFGENPTLAENFMRTAVMVALADGIYSVTEDEVLHKYCDALGLKVKALEALRKNLEKAKEQAENDTLESWLEETEHIDSSTIPHDPEHHKTVLAPIKDWLDGWDIHDPKVAHMVCKMIPAQCPFERDVVVFGKKVAHIPAMCKLNPVYDQLVGLRFRALSYLADECQEDVSKYF
ncbi:Mo-dependent nitrogenase C-terminal domain-containing protein [Okeania sp.]|uniref:Mo-dependent nitrogenase C-terminal domain-containing protein n=1 Tax=Okeania sp. TaxID=3100323 RepID=UPI002B4B004D|nr:Mo-dependent nitrogenase C-terminal domain-containing protein [Okeania sp.]MEB3343179.1 Mo-dependent nitrogenase C-terminal domain-containing protein [Okeania sp.]